MAVFILLAAALAAVAGGNLRETSRGLAEKSQGSVVAGVDGWLFFKEELEHLAAGRFWGESAAAASRTKDPANADPLPAILEYNRLLAEKGITLYLMPVPPKALVYPDKLSADLEPAAAAEETALYREFYEKLTAEGVKVIDLLPALAANRDKARLYCMTDTHYSGEGLALFAGAAAEALKKEAWYAGTAKKEYVRKPQKVTVTGDLTQMAGGAGPTEELELRVVTGEDGKPVESDMGSPVILLGDSHALVFQAGDDLHARGAGLFDHLSAELGFPLDLLGVRGSGVTPARIKLFQRVKQDSGYLDGKKALVWCFAAREFTGSGGWRRIPVAP